MSATPNAAGGAFVLAAALKLGGYGCNDDPGTTAETSGDAGSPGSSTSTSAAGDGSSSSGGTTSASPDGSTGQPPPATDTTAMTESGSTGAPIVLPTPCDEIASVFVSEPETEPNDTPEEATDLCTIDVVGSWHVSAEIGGDDPIDHFVFRSAGNAGVVPLLLDACFEVELDLQLLQLSEGELVPLWSGMSSAPGCEEAPQALPAGHDYLLVVAVPRGRSIAAATPYGW